jgi:hypothetical protein
MPQPDLNDPLDKLLQEQNHHIEDAGFTTQVVSSLPRSSRLFWLRPLLLSGAAIAGLILAIDWLPWKTLMPPDRPVALLDSKVLLPWMVVMTVLLSLIWGMVSAVRLKDEELD